MSSWSSCRPRYSAIVYEDALLSIIWLPAAQSSPGGRSETQEQLAKRARLSASAVGNLERGAPRPHQDTVRLLIVALVNLSDEQSSEFEATARLAASAKRSAVLASPVSSGTQSIALRDIKPRHNLPAATSSFVGRERELSQVRRLLWRVTTRLVTLTGAGGSGKTHWRWGQDLCHPS